MPSGPGKADGNGIEDLGVETFQSETVSKGELLVFEQKDHFTASRRYAWEADGEVTAVLREGSVDGPLAAIRASIVAGRAGEDSAPLGNPTAIILVLAAPAGQARRVLIFTTAELGIVRSPDPCMASPPFSPAR